MRHLDTQVGLVKAVKNHGFMARLHARAVVLHAHRDALRIGRQPHLHLPAGRGHKLGRVGQQVQQHLQNAVGVGLEHGRLVGQLHLHLGRALAEHFGRGRHRALHQCAHVHGGHMPFGVTRFDLGHVQHLVDQARQALGFGHDDAHELLALGLRHASVVLHEFGQRADGGERRAQFVRHRRHEVVLEPIQALQLLIGGAQLGGGLFQRARLVLQRTRIGADLRGLVQNAQHVFGRERFFLGHRGHQRTGRGAAHGPGELGFDKLHQPGIRPQGLGIAHAHALRVAVKQRLRLGGAQKALAQAQQVLRVGPPAPEHRAGAGRALEHIDKQQGLAGLAARRRAPQRHADIGHHIGQHAPEQ